jgi:hypothetical protein
LPHSARHRIISGTTNEKISAVIVRIKIITRIVQAIAAVQIGVVTAVVTERA